MNINRYVLCKERSLQKIISKQPKPNTTAIGVCSETLYCAGKESP